jgi:hypothetical protein
MPPIKVALIMYGLISGAASSIWVLRAFYTGTFYDPNPTIAAIEIASSTAGTITCLMIALILGYIEVENANTNGRKNL